MLEERTLALPTVDDVYRAAERIGPWIVQTPFVFSQTLSQKLGASVWLKFENLYIKTK